MHLTKKFVITLTLILFFSQLLGSFNEWQLILMQYRTTASIKSFISQHILSLLLTSFYTCIMVILPTLAAEALHYEVFPKIAKGSFRHYLLSTFFSRQVTTQIVIGYLLAMIMLGLQSWLFNIGYKFLNVWTDYTWVTRLSSSYLPFLTAFILAFRASVMEEIMFRVFAISWGKKVFRNLGLAILFAATVWGFGHSSYLVYPMWFRGLETTCVGIFLGWAYLRFGIISVITAHFAFDAFWMTIGLLFGQSFTFQWWSSLTVIFLPLFFAIASYIINKPDREEPMRWKLNIHQEFNLGVLLNYIKSSNLLDNKSPEIVRNELINHGWDAGVVDQALQKFRK